MLDQDNWILVNFFLWHVIFLVYSDCFSYVTLSYQLLLLNIICFVEKYILHWSSTEYSILYITSQWVSFTPWASFLHCLFHIEHCFQNNFISIAFQDWKDIDKIEELYVQVYNKLVFEHYRRLKEQKNCICVLIYWPWVGKMTH